MGMGNNRSQIASVMAMSEIMQLLNENLIKAIYSLVKVINTNFQKIR